MTDKSFGPHTQLLSETKELPQEFRVIGSNQTAIIDEPKYTLEGMTQDHLVRYTEFLGSRWWQEELRKYPSFALHQILPELEPEEVVRRYVQYCNRYYSHKLHTEQIRTSAATTGRLDSSRSHTSNPPKADPSDGSGPRKIDDKTHELLYAFIRGFAPTVTLDNTEGSWLGAVVRDRSRFNERTSLDVSGSILSPAEIIELFFEWSADPKAQEEFQEKCRAELDELTRLTYLTEPSKKIGKLVVFEEASPQKPKKSEEEKWRELGEAAHILVSGMTDGDECEECQCPLPETEDDSHDTGCKVGNLVHALSTVGIDPEDR